MKMMRLAALAASTVLASTSAHATDYYTDRSAFDADGGPSSYFTDYNDAADFTFAPLTFGPMGVSGSALLVPTAGVLPGYYGEVNGTGYLQFQMDTGGSTVTFSSATPFSMIGFDMKSYTDDFNADALETIAFLANTGEGGSFLSPAVGTAPFFGLKFDSPITSLTFSAPDGGNDGFYTWLGTDNLQVYFDVSGAVPEPASWAMMIGGFALAGGAMRRRSARVRIA